VASVTRSTRATSCLTAIRPCRRTPRTSPRRRSRTSATPWRRPERASSPLGDDRAAARPLGAQRAGRSSSVAISLDAVRHCSHCRRTLPEELFGRHYWCKPCHAAYARGRPRSPKPPSISAVRAGRKLPHGARGLLTALVEIGLDPAAVPYAAALVQELDEQAEARQAALVAA
jgi:hypothetical protein